MLVNVLQYTGYSPDRKEFSGPTCQFNSPEAEKLLLIYLVINHLQVTQHFFGRQAYVRTSNTGVRNIILGVQDFIIIQIGLMPPHGVI